jgi:hypothetical protein
MSGLTACRCIVEALAVFAVDPETQPGQCCVCPSHGQLVVWDGARWRWSNQPADIDSALPRTADGPDRATCHTGWRIEEVHA